MEARLERLEAELARGPATVREEVRSLRGELHDAFARQAGLHETRFEGFTRTVGEGLKTSTEGFAHTQTTRLGETNQQMKALAEGQKAGLEAVPAKVEAMTTADAARQEKLRETLSASLDQLRKDNEAKLEQMRATVDEKLQGTLEKRLGESFKLVSDRLELVHKGLGEMQTLATGVGDLKRVLTNVKSRGGWGEVQLGMLLEDMLTSDQFASNVAVQPGSAERVEYAVKLPGKGRASPCGCPSTPSSRTRTTTACSPPRRPGWPRRLSAPVGRWRRPCGSRPRPSAPSTSARPTPPTSPSCTCRPRACSPR